MKKMLMVFIIGLFVACGLMAQAPGDTLWTRTYGQPDMVVDVAYSVQQTTDDGYIVGGFTWDLITFATNFYLVKTNSNGDTLWTQTYGGTSDGAYSVQQTTDDGYIVGGVTNQMGITDIYLVKTNSNGDTLWTRTYGGNSAEGDYDNGVDAKQTNDGGYIITTGTKSFGAGDYDFYLIRTDSGGDTLWTRTYGGEDVDKSYSVQQTTDDGFIIAGTTRSFGEGDFNFYVVRTDSNGDTLWTRTYGGLMLDVSYSVQQTTDGGYVIAGRTRSFGAGGSDLYLVRTDSNGDTLWTRTYGGTLEDYGYSVKQTADDGFVFAGYSASFGMGGCDFYVVRTDFNGDTLWTRVYGGFPDEESAYSIDTVTDGGFIVAGATHNIPTVFGDIWLVRIAGDQIIGDFNSDGYVDATDLQMFGDHWLFVDTDLGWDSLYDLAPDGIIDAADLQVFGDHWNEGTPPKSDSGKSGKGPNETAGIVFDLDATTSGNQHLTSIPSQPAGTYIRIDVYCTGVHNLDTYQFEVIYDPTELEYVTATATNPITHEPNILTTNGGEALGWMINTSTPGVLSIAYTLAGTDTLEAPEGEGLVADIVFQVLSTVGDSLTFGDVHFYDSFGVMDIITDKGIAIFLGSVSIDNNGFDTTFEETKLENYPNPVKSYTTITYTIRGIKKADGVEIKIYNIVGQLVYTIEGRNGIAVCELGDFPNGIYFYKLETMDKTLIKKMLLLR